MMLMGDKKKMATIIVGDMMKDKKPDFVQEIGVKREEINPEKPMKDYDTGFEAAAQDLISAIKNEDVKAVSNALKAHYDMCMVEESEE